MIDSMLLEAVQLAREGRTVEARWLIQEVLRRDRANETAWLLMADCAETREEGIIALESCLRYVPDAARARVGLDLLRSEDYNYRHGGLLTDRLNLAVKNIKSQPRKLFEGEPVRRALDMDDLVKLRHALPAEWVPVTVDESVFSEAAGAKLETSEEPAAGRQPATGRQPAAGKQPAADEELEAVDQAWVETHTPREQRAEEFWRTAPAQEPAADGESAPPAPVEAFLVPPDLFTPEELTELEEALGEVPLARRRVSLYQDPALAWRSLSEVDLPETHRAARSTRRSEHLPAGRVLLYALVAALIVCLAAGLLLLAAFVLRGL